MSWQDHENVCRTPTKLVQQNTDLKTYRKKLQNKYRGKSNGHVKNISNSGSASFCPFQMRNSKGYSPDGLSGI